jgi:hypothetical protein
MDNSTSTDISKISKTFLEVANHTKSEAIYNGLLAFFLNPNEVHGLKDLVLNSIVKCIEAGFKIEEANLKNVLVCRELIDFKDKDDKDEKNLKRMDLFITTGNYVIGIENKIFNNLKNDLEAYSNMIKPYGDLGAQVIRIILSFKEPNELNLKSDYTIESGEINLSNGIWKIITYKQFFAQLELEIDSNSLKGGYLDYLRQMIDSIKSLEPSIPKSEAIEFDRLKKIELEPKFNKLKTLLERNPKIWGNKPLESEGYSIYYELKDNIQVYAYLTLDGWVVGLQLNGSIKTGKVSFRLSQLLHFNKINLPSEGYEYIGNGRGGKGKKFDIKEKPSIIAEEVKKLIIEIEG